MSRQTTADTKLLQRYGETSAAFETAGGYRYEYEIQRVLVWAGFLRPRNTTSPLAQFSGGQQMRATLARLLLEAPTLLLLDEPTNHLDIAALNWLEGYLTNYERAVLIVSHDRHFIDAFAREIWELENGQLTRYRGNFSHYRAQRAARRERQAKEHARQRERPSKKSRNSSANTSAAASRPRHAGDKNACIPWPNEAASSMRHDGNGPLVFPLPTPAAVATRC